MAFTAGQIAGLIEGTIIGDESVPVTGLNTADQAKSGDLTFAENQKYFELANQSEASVIVVDQDCHSENKTLIRVAKARIAYAKILNLLIPEQEFAAGVHVTAVVDPSAQIDPSAHIGPHCVVEANVRIGASSVLISGVHVGANSIIGENVKLFPQVTLYPKCEIGNRVSIHANSVIGADGYGYVFDGKEHLKIKQIGNVVIEDDVEIGSNTTIDRGAVGSTVIGKGTKIDNQVQIAHNVKVGQHCLLVSQVGIAGSSKLGNYVTMAGQSGARDHVTIADQVIVAARAGVISDISEKGTWMGNPARPANLEKRNVIASQQLPKLIRRVRELEKQIEALNKEN